jgi:hypothetical protein
MSIHSYNKDHTNKKDELKFSAMLNKEKDYSTDKSKEYKSLMPD